MPAARETSHATPVRDPPSDILEALATYSHHTLHLRCTVRRWRAIEIEPRSTAVEAPFTTVWITPMLSTKPTTEDSARTAGNHKKAKNAANISPTAIWVFLWHNKVNNHGGAKQTIPALELWLATIVQSFIIG